MKIKVFKKDLEIYSKHLSDIDMEDASKCFTGHFFGDNNRRVEVELKCTVDMNLANEIQKIAEKLDDQIVLVDVEVIKQLLDNPDTTIIKSLQGFNNGLLAFIQKNKIDGWIYQLDRGRDFMPYLISSSRHLKADPQYDRPAQVKITLMNLSPRKKDNNSEIVFYREHIYNKTIPEILASRLLFKENENFKKNYEEHIESYEKFHDKIGCQFIALKNGITDDSYRSEENNIEGNRLINDQSNNNDSFTIIQKTTVPFFNDTNINHVDEDVDIEEYNNVEVSVPFHPYIKMFDLENHNELWVLANCMKEYIYDKEVHDKLILPEDHRDLIDVLVYDADVVLEDIVSNKSGGTTILCKGEAGLGKTLTAEVYSETVEKPLYLVHSGQLGTDPDSIDKRLDKILKRAEKWGAILLLDEADVYIRKRDNSMQHNAIVAAFLRKLERFSGIVFMTTNRADDVDDAIVSRCIAIITYDYPEGDELFKIWKVLGDQYNISLDDELIKQLMDAFEKTSGRDVKELLKLASKYKSQRKVDIDFEMFRKCAMFRGLKTKHQKN